MKHLVANIFICAIIAGPVNGQNFLQTGKQWIYEYNVYDAGIMTQSMDTIFVGSDTLINNVSYKKLTVTQIAPCALNNNHEYLREEDGRIYRLASDLETELLMMDLYETVNYELRFESPMTGVIETGIALIDSFGVEQAYDGSEMEVQYMRILNNQSFDDDAVFKLYRDVGFVHYGLLFPFLGTGLCDFPHWVSFRCLITGQDTLHFSMFDCYESSIGIISSQDISEEEGILYPNPTFDYVTIPEDLEIKRIVNSNGQSQPVIFAGQAIDLSSFPAGIYIFELTTAEGIQTRVAKVVKH